MPFDIMTASALTPATALQSQAAAIPIRRVDGRPEVMLITTNGGRWTVPKGWPTNTYPDAESARREAYEEAGVTGAVETYSLGAYTYWKRTGKGRVILTVTAFALHVEQVLLDWPERGKRKRAWFSPEVAARLLNNAGLADLIAEAVYGERDMPDVQELRRAC